MSERGLFDEARDWAVAGLEDLRDRALAGVGVMGAQAAKRYLRTGSTVDAGIVAVALGLAELVKTGGMLRQAAPPDRVAEYYRRLLDPEYVMKLSLGMADGFRAGVRGAIADIETEVRQTIASLEASLGAAAEDIGSGKVTDVLRQAERARASSGRERREALDELLRRTKALLWYKEFERQMPLIAAMIEQESLMPLADVAVEIPAMLRQKSIDWLGEYFALTGRPIAQGRMIGELVGGTTTSLIVTIVLSLTGELAVARLAAGGARLMNHAAAAAERIRRRLPKRLQSPPPLRPAEVAQDGAARAASRERLDASAQVAREPSEALGAKPPVRPAPSPAAPRPHVPMPEEVALHLQSVLGRTLPDAVRQLSKEQLDRVLEKARRVTKVSSLKNWRRARQTALKGQLQEELTARLPDLQVHRSRWRDRLADDPVWDASTVQFPTEMRVGNAPGYKSGGRLVDPNVTPGPVKPRASAPASAGDEAGTLGAQGIPDEPGSLANGPDVPLIVLSHDRKRMRILMDVQVKSERNVGDLGKKKQDMGQFKHDRERVKEFDSEVALSLPDGETRLRYKPEQVTFNNDTELVAVTAKDVALPASARDIIESDFGMDPNAATSRLIELRLPMTNAEVNEFVAAVVDAMEKRKL